MGGRDADFAGVGPWREWRRRRRGLFGPLILVVVAVVFVLVLVGEEKWRGRKLVRDGNGN